MLLFLSNVGYRSGDMIKMKVEDIVYEDNKIDESIRYKRGMITFFMEKNTSTKRTRKSSKK
jgi:hypothetical protein